ncbi:MAG: hypothetical protein JNM09_03465 [Blastocatellia bacterium]|nr:hypothetical protein [Blastocatellia bacterium]
MQAKMYFPPRHSAFPTTKQPQRLSPDTTTAENLTEPSAEELRLRAEIESLRAELREAQRHLQHYEVLLRNAEIRKRELLAERAPKN